MSETKIVSGRISDTVEFSFSELALGDGTVSLPSLAFGSDQDTGIYRRTTNAMNLVANGANRLDISAAFVEVMNVPLLIDTSLLNADGTAALPAYSFAADTDTGIFRPTADTIAFATIGTERLRLTGGTLRGVTGLVFENGDGVVGTPSYSFASDTDTGIYRSAANELSFTTLGTQRVVVDANGFVGIGTASPSSYNGNLRQFVVANSAGNVGMTFRCATNNQINIGFQDAENSSTTGRIAYTHTAADLTDNIIFRVGSVDVLTLLGSGQLQFSDGSLSTPAMSFASDTDSGFYRIGANEIGLSLGGVLAIDFAPAWLGILDGTLSRPGLLFQADPDTGIYRPGANQVGIVCGGVSTGLFDSNTGSANQLTLNSNPGNTTAFALSMSNTATGTNLLADVRASLSVNDGNAGDPYILWAIGGPTRYWTLGIDNSNSDVMVFSTTAGGTAHPGTGDVFLVAPNCIQILDGTASVPGITFINDSDTGMYRSASNFIDFAAGATQTFEIQPNLCVVTGGIQPEADNTRSNGTASRRWSNLYATNVNAGDLILDNGWAITEGDKVGRDKDEVLLKSPSGKLYKFVVEEV